MRGSESVERGPVPRPLSRQLGALAKRFHRIRKSELEQSVCRPRAAYRRNDSGGAGRDNDTASAGVRTKMTSPGRRRFLDMCEAATYLFEAADLRPGELQLGLLQEMFLTVASRVFLEELPANLVWLRAVLEVKELFTAVAIQFPRRSGKTVIQAFFAAVIAVTQPNGNIISFHLTSRQGKSWLRLFDRFLQCFRSSPRWGYDEIERNSNEKLVIRGFAHGTRVTIAAFPGIFQGGANNVRGMGELTFCCMMDEYEFYSPEMPPTVLPMLANDAALIMVSSIAPGDRSGAAQIAYAAYPDGRPAVKLCNWTNSCAACRDLGYENRCTHNPPRPQHFQSRAGRERLAALMRPFDGAFEREMMNRVEASRNQPAFSRLSLERLAADRYDTTKRAIPDTALLYIGFDPSGGGASAAVMTTIAVFFNHETRKTEYVVRPRHSHTHTHTGAILHTGGSRQTGRRSRRRASPRRGAAQCARGE